MSVGPSFRCVGTDLSDNKHVLIGSQQFQQSYNALLMPYAYIGVGRSNNYVENFHTALATTSKRSVRSWTPIIPNSQLIIQATEANEKNWNLELFINPTDMLPLIVVACLVCLVLIGIVIIVFHVKEKQEDRRNKAKAFNYF